MSANQHFVDVIKKLEAENPELGASSSLGGAGYKPQTESVSRAPEKPPLDREERKKLEKKIRKAADHYSNWLTVSNRERKEYKGRRNKAHGEGYHFKQEGTQSGYFDPAADSNFGYGASSQRYYQSPEGAYDPADFTPDILVPKYLDVFGVNSPRDILYAKERYYDITGYGLWRETEHDQAYLSTRKINPEYLRSDEEYKMAAEIGLDMFEKGELDVEGFNAFLDYFETPFTDDNPALTQKQIFEVNNPDLIYREPRTLNEAKKYADQAYIRSLEHDLERNIAMQDFGDSGYSSLANLKLEEQALRKAIQKGALDFQTPEDTIYILYNGESIKNAARDQALLMKHFLEDNDIDLYKTLDLKIADGASGTGVSENKLWLNTGTALQAFETGGQDALVSYEQTAGSTMGAYSFYKTTPVFREGKQKFKDAFSVFTDIVSVIYPPAAPIAEGANAAVQGGDLKDVIEASGKAYATNKFADVTNEEILEGFDKLDIDVRSLPPSAQNVIVDTTKATLQGDSGTDAFKKSATGELLDSVDIDIDLPDIDLKTPQAVKDIGNALVSGVEAVGDVAEDILKPPLDFIGETFEEGVDFVADTFEPAVDFLDEKLDALGQSYVDPALQKAKELGQDVIDVVADVGEPVVDVIDEGLDILGEKVVDPALQAGKEFGQGVIDVGSDVLSKAEDIFIEPIKQGVEALSDVDLPDLNLPDIDLPDLNLPDLDIDFSLPSLGLGGMLAGGSVGQQKTPTEELFNKELFKFDTEIKSTQEMLSPIMNLRRYG